MGAYRRRNVSTADWEDAKQKPPAVLSSNIRAHSPPWVLEVIRQSWINCCEPSISQQAYSIATSLDEALDQNHFEFAQLLLDKYGVDLLLRDETHKRCCPLGLRIAQLNCENLFLQLLHHVARNKNLLTLFIKPGCFGQTALHAACLNGWLQSVKILVSLGADLSVKNSNGCRALNLALECLRLAHKRSNQQGILDAEKLILFLSMVDDGPSVIPKELLQVTPGVVSSPKSLQALCRITFRKSIQSGILPLHSCVLSSRQKLPKLLLNYINML